MLTCREIVDQSSDYLGHEMSFRQRLQYRMHLLMCLHCRRFVRQFSAVRTMLQRLPKLPVSQTQIDAVIDRIDSLDK